MSVKLRVWGDYALFTRPELKSERVSYDVITPSAARGIIESIFWHPGLRYVIDRIWVCKPINFINVKRNEVSEKLSLSGVVSGSAKLSDICLDPNEFRQQRAALILRDVEYVIEAHFEMTEDIHPGDSDAKFQSMLNRRIEKGQFYSQPYFGCREFPANFEPFDGTPPCPKELRGETDLGLMLWDMDFSDRNNIRPLVYNAKMKDGMIEVPPRESEEVIG